MNVYYKAERVLQKFAIEANYRFTFSKQVCNESLEIGNLAKLHEPQI